MSYRIYANHAGRGGTGPARPGSPEAPAIPGEALCIVRAEPEVSDAERAIVAILRAPRGNETVCETFARKEAELAEVFAALDTAEARALHQRLVAADSGDALALELRRLVPERRERLLAFLAG